MEGSVTAPPNSEACTPIAKIKRASDKTKSRLLQKSIGRRNSNSSKRANEASEQKKRGSGKLIKTSKSPSLKTDRRVNELLQVQQIMLGLYKT